MCARKICGFGSWALAGRDQCGFPPAPPESEDEDGNATLPLTSKRCGFHTGERATDFWGRTCGAPRRPTLQLSAPRLCAPGAPHLRPSGPRALGPGPGAPAPAALPLPPPTAGPQPWARRGGADTGWTSTRCPHATTLGAWKAARGRSGSTGGCGISYLCGLHLQLARGAARHQRSVSPPPPPCAPGLFLPAFTLPVSSPFFLFPFPAPQTWSQGTGGFSRASPPRGGVTGH